MFIDKTLTAECEQEALSAVQAIFPDSYIHCFGISANRFDIAVYESEEDFDQDAEDGENYRVIARYAVSLI